MGINLVDDGTEMFGVILEIHLVRINSQYAPFVLMINKILVSFVQIAEIINLHPLLILASTLLDLGNERRYGFAQVDHKIGQAHELFHVPKELHIGLIITFGEVAAFVVIRYEDVNALKDTAILNDSMLRLEHSQ